MGTTTVKFASSFHEVYTVNDVTNYEYTQEFDVSSLSALLIGLKVTAGNNDVRVRFETKIGEDWYSFSSEAITTANSTTTYFNHFNSEMFGTHIRFGLKGIGNVTINMVMKK